MDPIESQKRKEAIKGLINILILEAFAFALVVVVYLSTGNLTYLMIGLIGVTLLFFPLIIRWMFAHNPKFRAAMDARGATKPNSDEGGQ